MSHEHLLFQFAAREKIRLKAAVGVIRGLSRPVANRKDKVRVAKTTVEVVKGMQFDRGLIPSTDLGIE